MKQLEFAVFYRVEGNRHCWTAYRSMYNDRWDGFVGRFIGCGETLARAKADAIRQAKFADAIAISNAKHKQKRVDL